MDNNFIKWYKDKCTWAIKLNDLGTYLYLDNDIYGNKIYNVSDISESIEDVDYDFIKCDISDINEGDLIISLFNFEDLTDNIKSMLRRYELVISNNGALILAATHGRNVEYINGANPEKVYKVIKK